MSSDLTEAVRLERATIVATQAEIAAHERIKTNDTEAQALAEAFAQRAHAQSVEMLRTAAGRAARRGDIGESFKFPVRWDTVDLAALLALIFGPDMLAALIAEHLPEFVKPGPDAEERAATLAALRQQLDEAETREEDLIRASEAAGTPIYRRADARPEIVLRKA